MTVSEPWTLTVRAKGARAAGYPQRFARCVAMWCDAQRRVVGCGATRSVAWWNVAMRRGASPTVMSISPTRLIDYVKTWRGREATSRQRRCRIASLRQRQPTRRARLPQSSLDKQRNQPSHPALSSLFQGGLVMDRDDPEQAADRHARAAVMAIFAVILVVAIMAAFVTTLEGIDTRDAGNVTQPGTIGLAKPHPPLDRAPGEPVRR
jgi:hypothetical protein